MQASTSSLLFAVVLAVSASAGILGISDPIRTDNVAAVICPDDAGANHSTYFPVDGRCNQFIECSNGVPVVFDCPEPTLWNQEIETCDWPRNVTCNNQGGGSTSAPTTIQPTQPPTVTDPPTQPPTASTTARPPTTLPDVDCPLVEGPGVNATYFPVEGHCDQFIECANGVPVIFDCPPPTLWSQGLLTCDWPQNVNCSDQNATPPPTTQPPTSGTSPSQPTSARPPTTLPDVDCPLVEGPGVNATYFPVEGHCDQFIECANGVPIIFDCPVPTLWNQALLTCDWPQNVNCSDQGATKPPTTQNPTTATPPTQLSTSGSTTRPPTTLPDVDCPLVEGPGVNATYFPVEGHCDQFIECANGVPVIFDCPPPTLWNQALLTCDWPQNVNCSDQGVTKPPTTEPSTTSPPQTEPPTPETTTRPPTTLPDVDCPLVEGPGVNATYFPVEGHCNQFIECANGVPVIFDCPPPTLWNQALLTCDWPQNVHCSDQGATKPPTTQNPTSTTRPTQPPTSETTARPPSTLPDVDCPLIEGPGVNATYFPVEGHCDQFIECANGVPVIFDCPPPTLWNQALLTCDWPQNVNCSDQGATKPPTTENPTSTTPPNQPPTSTTPPTQPPTSETTARPPTTLPDVDCPLIEGPGVNATYFPVEGHCDQFIECANGVPVIFDCPPPTLWNQALLTCDWPQNVDCSDQGATKPPTTQPPTNSPPETQPPTTTTPPTQPPTTGTTIRPPTTVPDVDCPLVEGPGVNATYFPVEGHCDQFIECANGVPVIFDCPPPTLWNQALLTCDWPQNVDCSDQGATKPPTTQTPTTIAPPTELPTTTEWPTTTDHDDDGCGCGHHDDCDSSSSSSSSESEECPCRDLKIKKLQF